MVVPFDVIVNAVDANWNIVSTVDTVHIASTDPAFTPPANAPLVAGHEHFSVTLAAGPSWTLTATDVTTQR